MLRGLLLTAGNFTAVALNTAYMRKQQPACGRCVGVGRGFLPSIAGKKIEGFSLGALIFINVNFTLSK